MPDILSPTLPTYIDPKQASVFDSLPHTLLRKAVGLMGGNDPSTMMMAASGEPIPANMGTAVANPRSLIREFLDIVHSAPSPDPAKTFLNDKVTGSLIPHRTPLIAPQGFEFPPEMGPAYTSRPQDLIDKFVGQHNSYAPSAAKTEVKKIQQGGSYVRPRTAVNDASDIIRTMKAQGYGPDEIMKLNPNIHPTSILRVFSGDK